MPKLWNDTVAEHREAVREAALDATAAIVESTGVSSVTMTKVAGKAGVSRATLYKYYPDIESILTAWHHRQVGDHLRHLHAVLDSAAGTGNELRAVLDAYARMLYSRRDKGSPGYLHHNPHTVGAHEHLQEFLIQILASASAKGAVREDLHLADLSAYCLHALAAAGTASSPAAVTALVTMVLAGIAPAAPHRDDG